MFRATEYDSDASQELVGVWHPVTFTRQDQVDEPPKLLDLSFDPVGGGFNIPTISGRTTYQHDIENLGIEIDLDLNGIADVFAITDRVGRFHAALASLADGATEIKLRTHAISDETGSVLIGDWISHQVDYSQSTITPVVISSIDLVNDDGESPTDLETTDPRLRGIVDRSAYSSFLTIEFDVDNDGAVDGHTLTQSDLTWNFTPLEMEPGPVTVKARTKDIAPNGQILRSGWTTFGFTLEELASSWLGVESLSLVNDNGASSSDLSTSVPAITGSIMGGQGLGGLVVEVDHDGDGSVDGSVETATNSFTYNPSNLAEGWTELHVRVRTQDSSQSSQWTSFGFVYHSDPDGPEAQALANAYATFHSSNDGGSSTYGDSLTLASNTLENSESTADDAMDGAIDQAAQVRAETIANADHEYQSALASANSTYAAAMQAASAAYLSALANYSGNTTTFPFDPIQWPTAPGQDALQILTSDNHQPVPPRNVPTYTGPEFNFSTDIGYQETLAAATNAFNLTAYSANATRRNADALARHAFDQALQAANQQYDDALRAAQDSYREALQQEPSSSLSDIREEYDSARQTAQDTYDWAVDDAWDRLQDSIEPSRNALDDAIQAAYQNYYEAVQAAWDAYMNIVSPQAAPPSCQTLRNAWIGYVTKVFTASKKLQKATSEARHAYDSSAGPVIRDYNKEVADARIFRTIAISTAAKNYDVAIASYNKQVRQIKINATVGLEKATATALRNKEWAVADAVKAHD